MREVPEPVAGGGQHEMRHAERRQFPRERGALLRGSGRETLSEALSPGVDLESPSRLGVDEPQVADVWKLLFSRVPNLDALSPHGARRV